MPDDSFEDRIRAMLSNLPKSHNDKILDEMAAKMGRSKNDILRETIGLLNAKLKARKRKEERESKFPPIEPLQ